jgi:predicted kinase
MKNDNELIYEAYDNIHKPKIMYILRGISGSGKSYLSKQILGSNRNNIFSTDDFFMKGGEYMFDPKQLGIAHKWNQDRVADAIKKNVTPIIIDNTNTQKWEAREYVKMAVDAGYDIRFHETTTDWSKDVDELAKRNIHGVPREAIQRMLDRYEDHSEFTVDNVLNSKSPWE